MTSEPEPPQQGEQNRASAHLEWLAKVSEDIQAEYLALYQRLSAGPQNIQMAGHSGEDSWIRLLQDWLPPHYEVAKRKYIVPEVGDYNPKETDIVIFCPGYPKSLRSRTEILASGVAAAFSVKLSLDSSGIREAAFKASQLRRAIYPAFVDSGI